MIQPGYEWLARTLADSADAEARRFADMGSNGTRRRAYCEGVRDVLRQITDGGDPSAELDAILTRADLGG